jgi:hypothetical protein
VELIVENDPTKFAVAVARAIGREDLGHNARRYVEKHHDWRRNLKALDECLARAVAPGVGHELNQDDSPVFSAVRFATKQT